MVAAAMEFTNMVRASTDLEERLSPGKDARHETRVPLTKNILPKMKFSHNTCAPGLCGGLGSLVG